jgi:hypothetical protein
MYGFVIPDSEIDTVPVTIEVKENEPFYFIKAEAMAKLE